MFVCRRGRRCFVHDNKQLSNTTARRFLCGPVRRRVRGRCCGPRGGRGRKRRSAALSERKRLLVSGVRQRKWGASGAMAAGGSLSRSERKAAARAEILQQEEQRDRRRQVRYGTARRPSARPRGRAGVTRCVCRAGFPHLEEAAGGTEPRGVSGAERERGHRPGAGEAP